MAKRTKSYNFLLLGVFSLLAVGSWVLFDVYRGLTNTTLTEVQQKQIQPLKVDIGGDLVQKMLSRRQFDDFYLNIVQSRAVPIERQGVVVVSSPSAEPLPTVTPEASPSAEATASAGSLVGNEATTSGGTL